MTQDNYDYWAVSDGVAIPPSDYSEVRDLEDYHPGGDFGRYETSLIPKLDHAGQPYIRMVGGAGWNRAARKMMGALKFIRSDSHKVLVAICDPQDDRLRAGDYKLIRCEIHEVSNEQGNRVLEGNFYWNSRDPEKYNGASGEQFSTWRWRNHASQRSLKTELITSWRWKNNPKVVNQNLETR